MAIRENQGLQIALVIFVVLTTLLSVSTFVFFSKYDETVARIASFERDVATAQADTEAARTELKEFKSILGAAGNDSLAAVRAEQEKDFSPFLDDLAPEQRNYRALARLLADALRQKDGHLIDGQIRENTLDNKSDVEQVAKVHEFGEYEDKLNTATVTYLETRRQLMADVDAAASSKLAAQAVIERRQKEFDLAVRDLRSKNQGLAADVHRLQQTNGELFGHLNKIEGDYEVVDAEVRGVSQGGRRVWLNRGSADGLRQQVSFKVVDRDEPNPTAAKSKGSVEVLRVTEPHSAEARIVADDPKNPILPGDYLFSAAWQAGRIEHFALTGFIDVDGDGITDRDLVKQLIAASGGVIDAEVTDGGELVGGVTVDTKYLIKGQMPTHASSAKMLEAHAAIEKQAQYQSVKGLSIGKFLDYVGYEPQVRTVSLRKEISR